MLLLLNHYVTIAYHDDTHNVAKRLDVDVCAGMNNLINYQILCCGCFYLI